MTRYDAIFKLLGLLFHADVARRIPGYGGEGQPEIFLYSLSVADVRVIEALMYCGRREGTLGEMASDMRNETHDGAVAQICDKGIDAAEYLCRGLARTGFRHRLLLQPTEPPPPSWTLEATDEQD